MPIGGRGSLISSILLIFLFMGLFRGTAVAAIVVIDLPEPEEYIVGCKVEQDRELADQPHREIVESELMILQEKLPELEDVAWTVYLVPKKVTHPEYGGIAGVAYGSKNTIYLYAYPKYTVFEHGYDVNYTSREIRATVAHEIGHLYRAKFVKLLPGEWGVYPNNPEEQFAEDFRMDYGSECARKLPHKVKGFKNEAVSEEAALFLSLLEMLSPSK